MARTLPWFRLYSEAVDDPKLKLLAFEDRWHFIAILCCKCQGVIGRDSEDMTRRMVAVKLGLDLRELDEVARRLSEVGLIDKETFNPLAWDERQYKSDSSTERVREYRKRQQKQQSNKVKRSGNVSETAQETEQNRTDTDYSPKGESVLPAGKPPAPHQKIVDLYHKTCPQLSRVIKLTPARRQAVKARWNNELTDLDAWERYFSVVSESEFLTGKANPRPGTDRPFRADFDWLVKQSNCVKVMEGKYD